MFVTGNEGESPEKREELNYSEEGRGSQGTPRLGPRLAASSAQAQAELSVAPQGRCWWSGWRRGNAAAAWPWTPGMTRGAAVGATTPSTVAPRGAASPTGVSSRSSPRMTASQNTTTAGNTGVRTSRPRKAPFPGPTRPARRPFSLSLHSENLEIAPWPRLSKNLLWATGSYDVNSHKSPRISGLQAHCLQNRPNQGNFQLWPRDREDEAHGAGAPAQSSPRPGSFPPVGKWLG